MREIKQTEIPSNCLIGCKSHEKIRNELLEQNGTKKCVKCDNWLLIMNAWETQRNCVLTHLLILSRGLPDVTQPFSCYKDCNHGAEGRASRNYHTLRNSKLTFVLMRFGTSLPTPENISPLPRSYFTHPSSIPCLVMGLSYSIPTSLLRTSVD